MRAIRAHQRPIPGAVATVGVDERVAFIRRTYAHLAGAIVAFVAVSFLLHGSEFAENFTVWAWGGGRFNWLIVLGAFMGIGWLAEKWASSDVSPAMQYVGLGLYVVAQAVIFVPILFIASHYSDPSVIPTAGLLTVLLFIGLTGTAFITKKDFSFMRGALSLGMMGAFGVIIAGMLFGFTLGLLFSAFMVLLMSGYVLYYTSQIMAHWRPTQHVAASLALFAAIAMLFFYILSIVMSMSRD